MSNNMNPMTMMATASMQSSKKGDTSWYQAMGDAWGKTLDRTANDITDLSDVISNGGDTPSNITQLSAQALKMSFLSNSAHTAISTGGEALKTMAQKS